MKKLFIIAAAAAALAGCVTTDQPAATKQPAWACQPGGGGLSALAATLMSQQRLTPAQCEWQSEKEMQTVNTVFAMSLSVEEPARATTSDGKATITAAPFGAPFLAASGDRCRLWSVRSSRGAGDERVMCQAPNGDWSLAQVVSK